jgi:hypothetical protein
MQTQLVEVVLVGKEVQVEVLVVVATTPHCWLR